MSDSPFVLAFLIKVAVPIILLVWVNSWYRDCASVALITALPPTRSWAQLSYLVYRYNNTSSFLQRLCQGAPDNSLAQLKNKQKQH